MRASLVGSTGEGLTGWEMEGCRGGNTHCSLFNGFAADRRRCILRAAGTSAITRWERLPLRQTRAK
jgi:hypothetical protein